METKTLMFYINAIHDGGAERVMLQLAKRFAQAGYRSVLVTSFVDSWEYRCRRAWSAFPLSGNSWSSPG